RYNRCVESAKSMGQRGFWDEEQRIHKLHQKNPTLTALSEAIPWDSFRPLIEQGYCSERKNNAGRKRIDPIILFRMLMLQQLFNLSDEALEFQVNDRRSFEEFVGLGVMDTIPDATTVAFFRERLRNAGVIEELFDCFEQHLRAQGLEARGGQIIDATLVPVPKQRNTRAENQVIKQGEVPEDWHDKPNRLQQKDLDARWVRKNGVSHYGYKNSICIDAEHGFIRRYVVTPANIHDSQMIAALLDPENSVDIVWADSGYAGRQFEELLATAGIESQIHERGTRNRPLDEDAQARNKVKSKIRARVEHVFGQMQVSMCGKLTRRIGLARTNAWWGLRNLTFNFMRFCQKQRVCAVAG
ncbi:IS5 family transposase, partial [Synechococcus sp. 1G10]|uniref:IS5 family transposase n=1 Tax=Synechococcus sp. 1G10 TaxID=2025605 RepID=UPI001E3E8EA0